VGAAHQLQAHLVDEDAGKSAGRAQDGREQGASPTAPQLGRLPLEQQDAAAPYTPDAAQSAGRSCVVPEFAERPEPRDGACSEQQELRGPMR
jgi:hypothetical protein